MAIWLPTLAEPGAAFIYGPSHLQIFSELLRRKLGGRGTIAYFEEHVSDRLRIGHLNYKKDRRGNPLPATGFELTAREWARLGELVLGSGSYRGHQIVPANLLREAFAGSQANLSYGLTFWLNQQAPNGREMDMERMLDLPWLAARVDLVEISRTIHDRMNKFALGCVVVLVVLLFVAVFAALAVGGSYNRLVRLQQTVDQSWAQVQNVYQRRADLIPNLVNTVSGAANFEKSTLVEVTNARASVGRVRLDPNKAPTDAAQLQEFQAAQGQLSNALSRLLVVVERYPELRANQNFLSLQAQLEGTENRISVERGNFNSAVQNYNVAVRSFPTNLVAGMLGFAPRPFFTAQTGAERPPPVQFDFGSPAPAATASP